MVQKPERGKYLTVENVRVSYNHKNDTIHLTSTDPDLPNGSFFITLNKETQTESSLRSLLTEHNLIKTGNSKPDSLLSSDSLMRILKNQHFSETVPFAHIGSNENLSDYIYYANLMKIPTVVVTPNSALFDDVCIAPGVSNINRFTLNNIPATMYNPFSFNDKDTAGYIYFVLLEMLGGERLSVDKQVELEEAVKYIHSKSSVHTFTVYRIVEYLSASPSRAGKMVSDDLNKLLSAHPFYPFNHKYKESEPDDALTTIFDVSGLDVDKNTYYQKTLRDELNNVNAGSSEKNNINIMNVSVRILQRAILSRQIDNHDYKLLIFDMSNLNNNSSFLNDKFFSDTASKLVGNGLSSIIIT